MNQARLDFRCLLVGSSELIFDFVPLRNVGVNLSFDILQSYLFDPSPKNGHEYMTQYMS